MLDRKTYIREKEHFTLYINTVIGGFAITVSLACMGTDNPLLWFTLTSPYIAGLVYLGKKAIPKSLQQLRRQSIYDNKAKELAQEIHSREFGIRSMVTEFSPYFFGIVFYFGVYIFEFIKYFMRW